MKLSTLAILLISTLLTNAQSLRDQFWENSLYTPIDMALDKLNERPSDSTLLYDLIIQQAQKSLVADTLVLFSHGAVGNFSAKGLGLYDSLTLRYEFIYIDAYTDCEIYENLEKGIALYNQIIVKEIENRHGISSMEKIDKEIKHFIKIRREEYGLDTAISIVNNQNYYFHKDSIELNELEQALLYISNFDKILSRYPDEKLGYEIILSKDKKVVYQTDRLPLYSNLMQVSLLIPSYPDQINIDFDQILFELYLLPSDDIGFMRLKVID